MSAEVAAAGVGEAIALKLITHYLQGRRARQGAEAAALSERGVVYADFTTGVVAVVASSQEVVGLAPRPGLRAALWATSKPFYRAVDDTKRAMHAVNELSGRVRRVASKPVIDAHDNLLRVAGEASELMGSRSRTGWEGMWDKLQDARIEFEAAARDDCAPRARRWRRQ